MVTLIIDNYDSFTFNLYQILAGINREPPLVVKNDELGWNEINRLAFDNIVISPGPGRPEHPRDFSVCREALRNANRPLLGICLGHQGLAHFFGGQVIHAPEPVHGRTSEIHHDGSALFRGIPEKFRAVRYHSLVVCPGLPGCLTATAWSDDGLVMGIRHLTKPFWGVQFHPESICTEYGRTLLENFAEITRAWQSRNGGCTPLVNSAPRPAAPAAVKIRSSTVTRRVVWKALDFFPDSEAAFAHLYASSAASFWLDSGHIEPGLARFSFMGDDSGPGSETLSYNGETGEVSLRANGSVRKTAAGLFDFLGERLARNHCSSDGLPFQFNSGYVGYFGYELRAECGSRRTRSLTTPDAAFIFADRFIAFDHMEKKAYLVCLTDSEEGADARTWFEETEALLSHLPKVNGRTFPQWAHEVPYKLARPRAGYLRDVQECLRRIRDGESYEVCLTNKIHLKAPVEPFQLYTALRRLNPAPYSAFLRFGSLAVACSSPERFLSIDSEGWVETKPMKGTVPRGATAGEERRQLERLRNSVKDRAENLMIVDLARNDLGRVCEPGTVQVSKLMDVETFATVHQMVSTVRGKLRPGITTMDCVRAAFPGGSMTGAPKLRTMEILDQLETEARGVYSGALGFLSLNGSADLNIVIRTAVLQDGKAEIGVGGAIVSLSDPEAEFEETLVKGRAVLRAFQAISATEGE